MGLSVQFVAERILNGIPAGLLLAACAWLFVRLTGGQNSKIRFTVWFVALMAIVAVPFVPALHGSGSVMRVSGELTLPGAYAMGLVAAWGLVSAFALARIGFGVVRLRALVRNSVALPGDDALWAVVRDARPNREVDVRVSSEARVPTAIGFFRPTVLLPEWSLKELSAEEMSAVVLHELAHLERRDDWTNLLQKVVRAVFFFHPAVLWVEKRISVEREMACDEAVLARTGNAHSYARCLVSLAEKSFVRRTMLLAQAAVGRAREMSERVARILGGEKRATKVFKPVVFKTALAGFAGVIVFSMAALPSATRWVTFEDSTAAANVAGDEAVAKSMVVPAMARVDRVDAVARLGVGLKPAPKSATLSASRRTGETPVPTRAKQTGEMALATRAKRTGEMALATRAEQTGEMALGARAKLNDPQVVQAGLHESERQVVMVVQTTDYYSDGASVVGVTEWRVVQLTVPVKKAKVPEGKRT